MVQVFFVMLFYSQKYDEESSLTFARELSELPLDELISKINIVLTPIILRFSDLHLWIPLLNRFDKILQFFIEKYDLESTESAFTSFKLLSAADVHNIVSILKFSEELLSRCMSKTIYSSYDRLQHLLKCSDPEILYHSLKIIALICSRFKKNQFHKVETFPHTKKILHSWASVLVDSIPIISWDSISDSSTSAALEGYEYSTIMSSETRKNPLFVKLNHLDFSYYRSNTIESEISSVGATVTLSITNSQLQNCTSIHELLTQYSREISKESLPKFQMLLLISKSFSNNTVECLNLRRWLIRIYLMVLTVCNILKFDEHSNPHLYHEKDSLRNPFRYVSSIVTFIKPSSNINNESSEVFEITDLEIVLDAMYSIAYLSQKRGLRPDLLHSMNGNVSHGLLFKILQHIYEKISRFGQQQVRDIIERSSSANNCNPSLNLKRIFNLVFHTLLNFITMGSLRHSLVSLGLMEQLVKFMHLRSSPFKTSIGYACVCLNLLLELPTSSALNIQDSSQDSYLDAFIRSPNNGLSLLINIVGDQTDYIVENGDIFSKLNYLDDEIDITTKNARKIIEPLEDTSENEGTKFRDALLLKEFEFGYNETLLKFVCSLIKADLGGGRMRNLYDSPLLKHFNSILARPKLFGCKAVTTTLKSIVAIIHNEPTAYPILMESKTIDIIMENFESYFMEYSQLLITLADIIGAFALNKTGLERIQHYNLVSKLLLCIAKSPRLAKCLSLEDLPSEFAMKFEELARHYPELKPVIWNTFVKELVCNIPKLIAPKMKGVQFYKLLNHASLYYDETEPVEYSQASLDGTNATTIAEDVEDEFYLLSNVSYFAYPIVESDIWDINKALKEKTFDIDPWLDLLLFEKAPYDCVYLDSTSSIISTLKLLHTRCKGYGIDNFIDRTFKLLNDPQIQEFINYKNVNGRSFFSQFDDGDIYNDRGCKFMRALNQVNIAIYSFYEIYCEGAFNTNPDIFLKAITSKNGIKVLEISMKLFKKIIIEEIVIRNTLPNDITECTLPKNQSTYPPQLILKSAYHRKEKFFGIRKTNIKVKNLLQIRCIMEDIQSLSGSLFFCCTKSFLSLEKNISPDIFNRRFKMCNVLVQILADGLLDLLFDVSDVSQCLTNELQMKMYHLVGLHLLDFLLSSRVPIIAIAFIQSRGLIKLRDLFNKILRSVASTNPNSYPSEDMKPYRYFYNFRRIKQNNYSVTISILIKILTVYNLYMEIKSFNISFPSYFEKYFFDHKNYFKIFQAHVAMACYGLIVTFKDNFKRKPTGLLPFMTPTFIYGYVNIFNGFTKNIETKGSKSLQMPIWNRENFKGFEKQREYLVSIGFSQDDAKLFMDDGYDYKSINAYGMDKPSYIDSKNWDDIKAAAISNKFSYSWKKNCRFVSPQYNGVGTLGTFLGFRESVADEMIEWLFEFSQEASKSLEYWEMIVSIIIDLSGYGNSTEVSYSLLFKKFAKQLYKFKKLMKPEETTKLKIMLKLYGISLKDPKFDKCFDYEVSEIFERFLKEEYLLCDWFGYVFIIFESAVSSLLVLIGDEGSTCGPHLPYIDSEITDEYEPKTSTENISAELLEAAFRLLLKVKVFDDISVANSITALLIMYLQRSSNNAAKIMESGIINRLLRFVEHCSKSSITYKDTANPEYIVEVFSAMLLQEEKDDTRLNQLKGLINVLLRSFFENPEILRKLIEFEVKKSAESKKSKIWPFKSHGSIDLQNTVDHKPALIIRNPEHFVSYTTSNFLLASPKEKSLNTTIVLIEEGKDSANSHNSNTSSEIQPTDKKQGKEDDVEMSTENCNNHTESSQKNESQDFTGIMHLLLSELMRVKINDCIHNTPEQEKLLKDLEREKYNGSARHEEKSRIAKKFLSNSKYNYICYLLFAITELLFSYKQSKLEFLTFSKKKNQGSVSVKPRSTSLNFFLHQLIITDEFSNLGEFELKRRKRISSLARLAIRALFATTELDRSSVDFKAKSAPNDDPDMIFIRKFSVDVIFKAYKGCLESKEPANTHYGKIIDITTLCCNLVNEEYDSDVTSVFGRMFIYDPYFNCKTFIDRSLPNLVASIISTLPLNFPHIRKVASNCIELLNLIGRIKILNQNFFKSLNDGEEEEEVNGEYDDEAAQEEINQLFKNSSLGIYDVDVNLDGESEDYEFDNDSDSDMVIYSDDMGLNLGNGSDLEMDVDDNIDNSYDYVPSHISIDVDSSDSSDSSDSDTSFSENLDSPAYYPNTEGNSNMPHENEEEFDYFDENVNDEDGDYDYYGGISDSGDDSEVIDRWAEDYENRNNNDQDIGGIEYETQNSTRNFEQSPHFEYVAQFIRNYLQTGQVALPNSEGSQNQSQGFLMGFHRALNSENFDNNHNHNISRNFLTHQHQRVHNVEDAEQEEEDEEEEELDEEEEDGNDEIDDLEYFNAIEYNDDSDGQLIYEAGRNRRHRGARLGLHDFFRRIAPTNDLLLANNKDKFRSTLGSWSLFYHYLFSTIKVSIIAFPTVLKVINTLYERSVQHLKEKEENLKIKKEEKRKKKEEERRERAAAATEAARTADQPNEGSRINEDNNEVRAASTEGPSSNEPVMVQIGDREVDISGTGIDLDYLLALPMDMREEVYAQHQIQSRQRRFSSSYRRSSGGINEDFLNALSNAARNELDIHFNISTNNNGIDDEDSEDVIEDEDNEDEEADDINNIIDELELSDEENDDVEYYCDNEITKTKVYFAPLIDKSLISGILRLIFSDCCYLLYNFSTLLEYFCYNKFTRAETVFDLLFILQDGTNSSKALKHVFDRLTKKSIDSIILQMKPSYHLLNNGRNAEMPTLEEQHILPTEISTAAVANTILLLLETLLSDYSHLRYYFLTEHENRLLKVNGEDSINADKKYPINILMDIINKPIVRKESGLMFALATAINITTSFLMILKNKKEQTEDQRKETAKLARQFEDFRLSSNSLQSLVSILAADDCISKTFQQTLHAMKNLVMLQDAKRIFLNQLSLYAKATSDIIIGDLVELTKVYDKDNEIAFGVANENILKKFSTSSSSQNKLLRVLTAFNYLFDSSDNENKELIKKTYEDLSLGYLWEKLSEFLRLLENHGSVSNIATLVLPLIDCLMVVCKHVNVRENSAKPSLVYEENIIHSYVSAPIENLFFSFTNEHKAVLNSLVRAKPKLLNGPFSMLVINSKILDFDNKRTYFELKIHKKRGSSERLKFKVHRDRIFLDSYRSCAFKSAEVFRDSKFEISFVGEDGVDAGGVTREWYQVLSEQIFNPDYALFLPVAADATTFHPNAASWVNSEHLLFFKFVGRIIAKAIYDGQCLDAHFSRAVYKKLLNREVGLKEMESSDPEYAKSLRWILENNITDIIIETFSIEADEYGEHKTIDLIPNGRDIPVTEENKKEYVKLVVEYKLQGSIKEQLDSFMSGFYEIISKDLISIFDEQELELLISGLPDIDVDDWRHNSTYTNYTTNSTVIQWFWRAVKSFDKEQKAKLLQFVTGTSKVPLQGFSALVGVNGKQKFNIYRDYNSTDRLPSAHTCFNQLDLPAYESYEQLRESLLLAITEGHQGFGFA